jgi:hypothetical protein
MRPELNPGVAPLKQLLETIEVRNALMHFQHGKNLVHTEVPVSATHDRGHVTINPTPILQGQPGVVVKDSGLWESLQAERASVYYNSLVEVLRPVLVACPEDAVETVATLRTVIEEQDTVRST